MVLAVDVDGSDTAAGSCLRVGLGDLRARTTAASDTAPAAAFIL